MPTSNHKRALADIFRVDFNLDADLDDDDILAEVKADPQYNYEDVKKAYYESTMTAQGPTYPEEQKKNIEGRGGEVAKAALGAALDIPAAITRANRASAEQEWPHPLDVVGTASKVTAMGIEGTFKGMDAVGRVIRKDIDSLKDRDPQLGRVVSGAADLASLAIPGELGDAALMAVPFERAVIGPLKFGATKIGPYLAKAFDKAFDATAGGKLLGFRVPGMNVFREMWEAKRRR